MLFAILLLDDPDWPIEVFDDGWRAWAFACCAAVGGMDVDIKYGTLIASFPRDNPAPRADRRSR